jgi:hypothetical protein
MRPRFSPLLLALLCPLVVEAAALRVLPGPFASGKAFLSCTFDGVQQSCFLDTGSAMTLVADPDRFSHYPKLGNFRFKSASGNPEEVETIQIRTVIIDEVEFSDTKVGCLQPNRAAESTIGIDLIGRQPFSVTFRRSPSLHLNPTPPRELSAELQVDRHRLISLPIAFDVTETRAMWDTGSSMTAVDRAFVKTHAEDFKPTEEFMKGTDGAGHSLLVKVFRAKKITIGPRSFSNVRVVAVDLSLLRENVSPQIHAVIGFNLIRKADWFFDPQNKSWRIR